MADLSAFSENCAYCYRGVKEGITVCQCGISLCNLHDELHFTKANCSAFYSLIYDENKKAKVKADFDTGDLENRINIRLNNGMLTSLSSKECTHIYDSANISMEIEKDQIKCEKCDIKDNIWICLDCGHQGCGRKQAGTPGNGHAMEHYMTEHSSKKQAWTPGNGHAHYMTEHMGNTQAGTPGNEHAHFMTEHSSNTHSQSILASSIVDGIGDVFCYICSEFIQNPHILNIKINNNEIKNFDDGTNERPCVKSNIMGIVNEGLTCYISSVLHLIFEILKGHDLSIHFTVCEANPMDCICCQLIKIFNESETTKNEIKTIRIVDFLKCFFKNFPQFSLKKQEDCAEVLMSLLEVLKNYENCMMLPPVTESLDFSISEKMTCKTCGIHSESTSTSNILYLAFHNTLQEGVDDETKPFTVICECKGDLERRASFDKLPKFLICSVGRYKQQSEIYIKIEDSIKADSVCISKRTGEDVPHDEAIFEIKGAIIHKGKEIGSGHYVWWLKEEECYIADDDRITASEMASSEQGSLFLMKLKD